MQALGALGTGALDMAVVHCHGKLVPNKNLVRPGADGAAGRFALPAEPLAKALGSAPSVPLFKVRPVRVSRPAAVLTRLC